MCDYTLTKNSDCLLIKCRQTQETELGVGYSHITEIGMYVPPDVKKKNLKELIKLIKWVLSELKEQ